MTVTCFRMHPDRLFDIEIAWHDARQSARRLREVARRRGLWACLGTTVGARPRAASAFERDDVLETLLELLAANADAAVPGPGRDAVDALGVLLAPRGESLELGRFLYPDAVATALVAVRGVDLDAALAAGAASRTNLAGEAVPIDRPCLRNGVAWVLRQLRAARRADQAIVLA